MRLAGYKPARREGTREGRWTLLDYVDMDGAALLAEDIASGVVVDKGICRYASAPGTGAQLLRENPLPLN